MSKVGQIDERHFSGHSNLTRGARKKYDDLTLAELLDLMLEHRVPGDVQTAAFTAVADNTWEDVALVTLLNAQLSTPIRTGEAVVLRGVFEFINGEAAINESLWADGGTATGLDKEDLFISKAAAASEFVPVTVITDGSGNIKFETEDKANVSVKFHLKSFRYARFVASA
jgi:hypothetical protein